MLALVLAFSLAAVPAFAAGTEAESSTSDTAYGQLHNGLLSEICLLYTSDAADE